MRWGRSGPIDKHVTSLAAAAVLISLALHAVGGAAVVALYEDGRFIDPDSSNAVTNILTAAGHTITTFTDTTPADFVVDLEAQDFAKADVVLVPQLLNFGRLVQNLTDDSKRDLSDFVAAGGGLIAVGAGGLSLSDDLFYPGQFASTGTGGPSSLAAPAAAGTRFETGPATLTQPANSAMNSFAFSPPGSANVYEDAVGGVTVFVAPFFGARPQAPPGNALPPRLRLPIRSQSPMTRSRYRFR